MKKVRIDKWLWSVRIFKTRTKATDACKAGRVKIGEKPVKASTLIVGGETLNLRKNSFDLVIKVKELLERRVSATLAEPCYENLTPESELNKYKEWYIGKAAPERRERGAGRPTKRERRTIDNFKDNWMEDFED